MERLHLYDRRMRVVVVEVGDWEHECCGPTYERDTVIDLLCLEVPATETSSTRYVETHHDLTTRHRTVSVKGRVSDIVIRHPDGTVEAIERLPSGRSLRGFEDHDDGHLEQPRTGQPVTRDSDRYLLTVLA